MKKYNVFDLWVVKADDYYFICEKLFDENTYREIFTKEKVEVLDNENLEPLKNYYSLLVIMNYVTGEPLILTKKELLVKYAEINSSYIERRKQYNSNYEIIIREQDEYIKALKELGEKNPERAREEAIESLRRTGILNENCELDAPYNMSSSEKVENYAPSEHGRTLIRKNNQN